LFFAKNAIRQSDFVYLVEGYTDVISMHQAGVENVVASSGTSLTENQIKLLKRHTENVTVLYDGDAAGIKASMRGIDMILEQGLNVKVVPFPDGEDPDSYSRKVGSEAFTNYLVQESKDFILFKVKLLLSDVKHDPLKKAQVTRDIVESISKIPDGIKRMAFIKECAVLLEMNESLLITELNKSRSSFVSSKEKEWLSAEPKEQPQVELAELLEEEPIYEQERYFIKMLMLHGDKPVEGFDNVAHYLMHRMQELELELEQETMRLLLSEIRFMMSEQLPLNQQSFINHSNPLISATTASLLTNKFEVSPKWLSKYDVQMESPEEMFMKDIESALLYMEKHHLTKLMKQAQEELKKAQEKEDENELTIFLEVISLLNAKQQELSNKAGIVIWH
jgi:DNA primase